MATLHIDGKTYEADPSKNLLEAALSAGLDLPYFCWHPALGSVGACRQCAVRQYRDENDKNGQIVMACMVPVTDGARISIADPEATEFRSSVVEWLMTNHPHDCPVCDEGGECHLQDMTVMTGHCSRSFRFKKRTFENQYLGPFLNHEMNRCIQCYRCVRFYNDYAGGHDLGAFASHNHVYFGRHEEGVLESEFSGNLAEVCPTGVFTDKTLKGHYSRKWDMQSAPSICNHCSVGCNTIASSRYGAVRRILNRYHHDINGYFLCDRGRYGYEHGNHPDRPSRPRLRSTKQSGLEPETTEVLAAIGSFLNEARGIAAIGSPRASLESNYALQALAGREAFSIGIAEASSAVLDALVAALREAPGGPASVRDIEHSDAVFVLGEDPSNTAPRIALALRQSVRQVSIKHAAAHRIPRWHDRAVRDLAQGRKGPLHSAWPAQTRLDEISKSAFCESPNAIAKLGFAVAQCIGEDSSSSSSADSPLQKQAKAIAADLLEAEQPLVVTGTALESEAIIDAARAVVSALAKAGKSTVRLAGIAAEANSIGAHLLQGQALESIVAKVMNGECDTLIVAENDLYRRLPHATVDALLDKLSKLIVIDCIPSSLTRHADAFLPAATIAESDGSLINCEGRGQRFFQALSPKENLHATWDWVGRIQVECQRSDTNPWPDLDTILAKMAADCPELAGIREAAPGAGFRIHNQKIPRSPRRFSGRTSILAHESVHEPKPPEDKDAAMSFSMEGSALQPPAALVSHYWSPGWNSAQALNKFQEEVGGPNRGGPPGLRLFPGGQNGRPHGSPSTESAATPDQLLAIPLYQVFGSDELSNHSAAVRERSEPLAFSLSAKTADRLGLADGDSLSLRIGEQKLTATVRLDPVMSENLIGIPVGLSDTPVTYLPLPAQANVCE
ncbi:MAG: NADH-quinone oxidoreductase subunit NuoG [Opitutales bacterium]|nr:NADH-quinone oxidoreductase subunit NuoG [Opitutales bacterium]